MSADEPIQLPGLAAERRAPSAAVCAGGHVLSWFVDPSLVPGRCPKCGEPVLVACPACSAPLPPDGEMLQWVPYHGNCMQCGAAYPWKAADVARAKRTLAEFAETEQWDLLVRERADALIDEIAADRGTPSAVEAALRWLAGHGASSARAAVLDFLDTLPDASLKQALRAKYPPNE